MFSNSEAAVLLARHFWDDVPMRTKEAQTCAPPGHRQLLPSTTSGPIVVAAVFCLVFLVMGAAFSFSAFASELGDQGPFPLSLGARWPSFTLVASSRAPWPIGSARIE